MLVLTRYIDERIYIGDDIVITVCDIVGDKVRIGIDAPRDAKILREELRGKPRQPTTKNREADL